MIAQLVFGVELQPQQDAEARAQRRAEQAGTRGGADKGEGPDLHDVGARRRALPDDDVELVVFERGVELLFEHRLHAVDFVEEEHLPFAQIGEDRRQVALDLQRRARGLLETDVQLVGDDGGEGGLAQPGRAEEQYVIERLAAGLRRLERDGQLFLGFRLADELAQPARAQLQLEVLLFVGARGADQSFPGVSRNGSFLVGWSGELSRAIAMVTRSVAGAGGPGKIRLHSRELVQSPPENGNETTHRKIVAVYSRLRRPPFPVGCSLNPQQNKHLRCGNEVANTTPSKVPTS